MVVGVIYSTLDGSSDPKRELAMVKQSLMQAVPSVAPVQTGEWNSSEPVYANPNGGPFLVSFHTMEKTMQELLERTKALEAKSEVFEKKSIDQERELMMLRPVKDTAIGICDRFFATFLKSKASGHIILGNHSVIEMETRKLMRVTSRPTFVYWNTT